MNKIIFLMFSLIYLSNAFSRDIMVLNKKEEFTPSMLNRYSILLGLNPSLTNSTDATSITFSYGRKLENYWIDSNFVITNGLFRELSANNQAATSATDDQLFTQKNSLTTIGVGIGRETRYFQNLLPIDDIYELTAANITYNSYKEGFSSKSFSGPGILTKFAVHKKISQLVSFGTQFNYQIAVVKRGAETETETSSDRSLTLGFLTIGLDLTFYL